MPELVTKNVKVNELRAGDVIIAHHGAIVSEPVTVVSVTHKATWTYIYADHGTNDLTGTRPLRWRGDDDVRIQRSTTTAAEMAATVREIVVDTLRKMLHRYLRLQHPLNELEVIVEKARTYEPSNGVILNHSNLADVLEAQALYKQAVVIRATIRQRSDSDVNAPDDVLNVSDDVLLDAWAVWYYKNVLRDDNFGPSHNPLSRSTSTLSNLLEDLDRWAIEKVKTEIVWSQGVDELKTRVARMLAEAEARKSQQS